MNFRKKTFRELRKDQYSYNLNLFPYLNSWIKNPYSFIKARFYMESSAILVYLLLKTTIKPNTVTIFYCLAGVLLRLNKNEKLCYLSQENEADLLGLDSEQYRKSIQK